jgi:hypothetical protein
VAPLGVPGHEGVALGLGRDLVLAPERSTVVAPLSSNPLALLGYILRGQFRSNRGHACAAEGARRRTSSTRVQSSSNTLPLAPAADGELVAKNCGFGVPALPGGALYDRGDPAATLARFKLPLRPGSSV